MGLIKDKITTDSGTAAAVSRLQTAKPADLLGGQAKQSSPAEKAYKPRDYDAEARGKVKCVMFEAALQSPAIAGLKFKNIEEYLVLVEQAADAGVKYTWK